MKMKRSISFFSFLLSITMFYPQSVFAQACEIERPIIFGDLDWDSALFHNAVARYILENGYGCKTDAIPGSTVPLYGGTVRGDIDIIMEIWTNTRPDIWIKGLEDKKVEEVSVNFDDAFQHWYIPRYLVEGDKAPAKGLKSVSDLQNYRELFRDPEEPKKGRFYNCISGWTCEIINTKKLSAYNLDDSFVNFRPGTGAALVAAIEAQIRRKRPILFHYWGPTWVLGKLGDQVVALEEPPYDNAIWETLMEEKDPQKVTKATAYPRIQVAIGVNNAFKEKVPNVITFLKKYKTTSAMVSEALAFMQDNGGSVEKSAKNFLISHPDVWRGWVSTEVANKIALSLK